MLIANVVMAATMLFSMRLPKSCISRDRICYPSSSAFVSLDRMLSHRFFDVWVMLGFGVLGFLLESLKIPLAPFIIGFVLGPIAEENLTLGLQASNGSFPSSPSLFRSCHRDRRCHAVRTTGEITIQFTAGGAMKKSTVIWHPPLPSRSFV